MKNLNKQNLYYLVATIIISSTQIAHAQNSGSHGSATSNIEKEDISIKWTSRKEIKPPQHSIEICIKKIENKWSQMQECDLSKSSTEALSIEPWKREIYLRAEPPKKLSQMGSSDPINGWECFNGALGTSFRNELQYSICASDLTKNIADGAEMLIGNLFNVALGTVRSRVTIDTDLLLKAATESGALDTAEAWKQQVELQKYRDQFESANTSYKFDAFIQKYINNDPDNLLPQATMRRDELRVQEERNRAELRAQEERSRAMAEQERLTQLKISEQIQKQEDIRRNERQRAASDFRKTIKVETITNCGPVLEVKEKLVKVYSPVQNYGNEHWIDRGILFPHHYSCTFLNGQYRPPAP